MAIKELLTDLTCKNATAEGAKIRKLHDGQGLYLWYMRTDASIGDYVIRSIIRKNPYHWAFILLLG